MSGAQLTAREHGKAEVPQVPSRPSPTRSAPRAAGSLWSALRPDDDREVTLYLGLGLLALGLALTPAPWLALVVPGAILTLVALAAYVLPRRATPEE